MYKETDVGSLLRARIRDAFDCASRYRPKFVGFLDTHEVADARKTANMLSDAYGGCSCMLFGGYSDAERVYLGIFPPYTEPSGRLFPISALKISWRFSHLSHRDFLGAILGLGISREKIGDILTDKTDCTVFTDSSVAAYIVQNLSKVGNAGVTCCITDGASAKRQDDFKDISAVVSSARLDCIVSALTGASRAKSADMIKGGLVSCDHVPCFEISDAVCEKMTISIRGKGRFIIDKLGPKTRKGRLSFAARKFL